ncbi:glycosyltransferase [Saccharicrinis sp. GN24d3]|uniref:glycosyltransferase n=1 Tax=Saccharicrinis sp. GN24d3 TaxID=3458416 RepID=UPI0040357016
MKGWNNMSAYSPAPTANMVQLSCIIAFRNENKNITKLISGLQQQTDKEHEIILVDDGSSDGSYELARNLTADLDRFVILKNKGVGKKAALETGVGEAQSDYVVFTDADCIHPPNWLRSISRFLGEYKVDLLVGAVVLIRPESKFELFQSIDFLSLVTSGAGAIGSERAIMCNGANLAVKKSVWLNAIPQLQNGYASGDDIFLLQFCVANQKEIRFLKNKDSIVETFPQKKMKDFLKQRVRWASKSKGYTDFFTLFVAWLVFLTNLMLAAIPIIFIIDSYIGLWTITWGIIKMMFDYVLINKGAKFFNVPIKFKNYIWIACVYPLYIVISVYNAAFSHQEWKGRAI